MTLLALAMLSPEERRQRLEVAAEVAGGKAELGRALGYLDGAYVGQMIRGERPITEKTLRALAELPQVAHLFAFTVGPEAHAVGFNLASNDHRAAEESTPYLPGFEAISVPKLANTGSMGAGVEQLPDDVVVGRLTLSPQWVTKTLKPLSKIENLRFIHGYGDSMEPTFYDGDILLVDAGMPDVKVDGIYVLEANDRLYIKRVRQRLDGAFEISSDNPNVKTVDVLTSGSATVNVKGRVVWVWNGKKL